LRSGLIFVLWIASSGHRTAARAENHFPGIPARERRKERRADLGRQALGALDDAQRMRRRRVEEHLPEERFGKRRKAGEFDRRAHRFAGLAGLAGRHPASVDERDCRDPVRRDLIRFEHYATTHAVPDEYCGRIERAQQLRDIGAVALDRAVGGFARRATMPAQGRTRRRDSISRNGRSARASPRARRQSRDEDERRSAPTGAQAMHHFFFALVSFFAASFFGASFFGASSFASSFLQ
jgi:hypothetical protein